jgi:hypothetical protein
MMARRSFFHKLPVELQEALHRRFIESGWGSYEEHADWLTGELEQRGLEVGIVTPVSKSTMVYTGKQFQQRLVDLGVVTQQAKAIVAASGARSKNCSRDCRPLLLTRIIYGPPTTSARPVPS